jgi:hypothetical protein
VQGNGASNSTARAGDKSNFVFEDHNLPLLICHRESEKKI